MEPVVTNLYLINVVSLAEDDDTDYDLYVCFVNKWVKKYDFMKEKDEM